MDQLIADWNKVCKPNTCCCWLICWPIYLVGFVILSYVRGLLVARPVIKVLLVAGGVAVVVGGILLGLRLDQLVRCLWRGGDHC